MRHQEGYKRLFDDFYEALSEEKLHRRKEGTLSGLASYDMLMNPTYAEMLNYTAAADQPAGRDLTI